jgi:excisionase family DNA binding protein
MIDGAAMENKVAHDPLMTAKEAAEYLKLSEGTVRNMAAAGDIPRIKIGTALRFRLSDLNGWVESRKAVPA